MKPFTITELTNANEFFDHCLQTTLKIYDQLEGDNELAKFFILTKDNKVTLFLTPLFDDHVKSIIFSYMREVCKQTDAIGSCFISEAWMGSFRRAKDVPEGYQPINDPNRKEVLILVQETKISKKMHVYTIDRSGDKVQLKDHKEISNGSLSGRGTGILCTEPIVTTNN